MPENVKKYQMTPEEVDKKIAAKAQRGELGRLDHLYRISKRAAKREEKLDLEGEETVSTKGRQELYEVLKRSFDLGRLISEEDITLIKNAFYTHSEFIDKEKLKFVIDVAYKRGRIAKVDETVNEFLSLLRDTSYYKPVLELKKWLRMKSLSSKIDSMRRSGASSSQISERLHISTAEVKVFSERAKEEMPNPFKDLER